MKVRLDKSHGILLCVSIFGFGALCVYFVESGTSKDSARSAIVEDKSVARQSEVESKSAPLSMDDVESNVGAPGSTEDQIVAVIGEESQPRWCTYGEAVDMLGDQHVPILRGLLRDPSYRNRWAQISRMILWLSNPNDGESVDAVLEYVKRKTTWNKDDTPEATVHIVWRLMAFGELGLMESDKVMVLLRESMSREGARDLISEWIDLPHSQPYDTPERLLNLVRSNAARGLVLSRSKVDIELVLTETETLIHRLMSDDRQQGEASEDIDYEGLLLLGYIDSMVINDFLGDYGSEVYLRTFDSVDGSGTMHGYMERYNQFLVFDGGTFSYNPCPICGKLRE